MVLKTLKQVFFDHPLYFLLTLIISTVTFVVAVLFPNLNLLQSVLLGSNLSLGSKAVFVFHLLQGITTNHDVFSASYIIVVSTLFGMNISLIIYYLRKMKESMGKKSITSVSAAIITGMLGMGCVACGSLFLSALLPFLGGTAIITFLPFAGREIGVLAVLLFFISLVVISKGIAKAGVCEIK